MERGNSMNTQKRFFINFQELINKTDQFNNNVAVVSLKVNKYINIYLIL